MSPLTLSLLPSLPSFLPYPSSLPSFPSPRPQPYHPPLSLIYIFSTISFSPVLTCLSFVQVTNDRDQLHDALTQATVKLEEVLATKKRLEEEVASSGARSTPRYIMQYATFFFFFFSLFFISASVS